MLSDSTLRKTLAAIAGLSISVCCFGQASPGTSTVLEKATARVERFVDQLSDVKCTESVQQLKLAPNGKTINQLNSTFDYLVIMQAAPDDLLLNESRLAMKEAKPGKNFPMLITNGFSTLFLVFHPYYRESFTFQELGEDQINGERAVRVHFEHLHGTKTPMALAVRGREYPLDIEGTAWIDPQSGAIRRIEAGVENSMADVGVKKFDTEVDYGPVKLTGVDPGFLFPLRAKVELESLKQHWINIHSFSDYKRFSVSTDVAISEKR